MDVSVIIVNYNTLKMTRECIESVIAKTSGVEYEIILVDNGSTDGSKEYFEKDKRIKYIYSSENLGFGKANNLGAKYATGKYIFLLNSDTILIENSIYLLFEFIDNQSEYIACGAQLLYRDLTYQKSEIEYPSLKRDILEIFPAKLRNIFCTSGQLKYKIYILQSVQSINGADVLIRRDIFEYIKGFDTDFFMYFEETDLFYRLNEYGYKACVTPKTKIIHINGGSFKNKSIKKSLAQYQSKLLFYKKHNSYLYLVTAKVILTVSLIFRYYTFRGNFNKGMKIIWH